MSVQIHRCATGGKRNRDDQGVEIPSFTRLSMSCAVVCFLVMADFLLAIRFARDDGPNPLVFEKFAKRIGVTTLVRQKLRNAWDQADS
jgi:hypothetical protein